MAVISGGRELSWMGEMPFLGITTIALKPAEVFRNCLRFILWSISDSVGRRGMYEKRGCEEKNSIKITVLRAPI